MDATAADETNVKHAENMERLTECFKQRLSMLRLKDAWEVAVQLNNRSMWLALSGKSMEHLDIGLGKT